MIEVPLLSAALFAEAGLPRNKSECKHLLMHVRSIAFCYQHKYYDLAQSLFCFNKYICFAKMGMYLVYMILTSKTFYKSAKAMKILDT